MFFKSINLGITSNCNANCKFCMRNHVFVVQKDLPLDILFKIFNYSDLFTFCGRVGDFIFHKNSLQIIEYLVSKNKKFIIETNASIHDEAYWKKLSSLTKKPSEVRFVIDDIKHKTDFYRGTDTQTVIKNIKTFVKNGGNCSVKSIVFKFNENHITVMQKYFNDVLKIPFKVILSRDYDKDGVLSAPKKFKNSKEILQINSKDVISCHAKEKNSVFVNEFCELVPCCYIIPYGFNYTKKDSSHWSIHNEEKYIRLKNLYLKNRKLINLKYVSVEEAYNNEFNQFIMNNYKNNKTCKLYCSQSITERKKLITFRDFK